MPSNVLFAIEKEGRDLGVICIKLIGEERYIKRIIHFPSFADFGGSKINALLFKKKLLSKFTMNYFNLR